MTANLDVVVGLEAIELKKREQKQKLDRKLVGKEPAKNILHTQIRAYLIEELKHGTLDLAVTSFVAIKTLGTNGVELVDENNRRLLFLGQRKRIAYKPRTVANVLLHQLWGSQPQKSRLCNSDVSGKRLITHTHTICNQRWSWQRKHEP